MPTVPLYGSVVVVLDDVDELVEDDVDEEDVDDTGPVHGGSVLGVPSVSPGSATRAASSANSSVDSS